MHWGWCVFLGDTALDTEPSPLSKSARLGVNSLEGGVRTPSDMQFKRWRGGFWVFLVLLVSNHRVAASSPCLLSFRKQISRCSAKNHERKLELASHGREKSLA